MKITRRMEWPEPRNITTLEELSEYSLLLYQTLTEESGLRAGELDVAFTDGYNVALGHEAGESMAISLDDTEGIYNVFVGHQAGYSNTTGIKNIGIGYRPLYTNTTGGENTAFGSEALYSNTTGANNVALGNDALYTNATGNYNVAVGFEALKVSTVSNNVAVGYQALAVNTSGANNIAIGYQTLDANSTGAGNVAIGESALTANTTASFNLAIGYNALASNTDGHTNVAIGYSALTGNTSADYNIAIGYQSLDAANTGDSNIAIGFGSLGANTSGYENIGIGYNALTANVDGYHNVGVGYQALMTNTTSYGNVAIGHQAMEDFNVATETDAQNVAVGRLAMANATIGQQNTAIGAATLGAAILVGSGNVAVGRAALTSVTSGGNNMAVGAAAGYSLGTGAGNVFVGYNAGYSETGSNTLYIANSNTATPLIGGVFPNTSLTFTSAASTFSGTLGCGALTATSGTFSGNVFIGDTANTKMTQGLTINQGAADNEILAFKSSDVAHGITDIAETDTYGIFSKVVAATGGAMLRGFSADEVAVHLSAMYTTDNVTKTTAGRAPIDFMVYKKSGTGIGNVGANANIFTVRAYRGGAAESVWILDEDGDTWQDGNITAVAATLSGTLAANGKVTLGAPTELTIASGVIAVTRSYHTVDTQSDDASDNLDTITGGVDGMVLTIRPAHNDRSIVVTETGNIICDGAGHTMSNYWATMTMMYDATLMKWLETGYSSGS